MQSLHAFTPDIFFALLCIGSDCSGVMSDGTMQEGQQVIAAPGSRVFGLTTGCLASAVAGSCSTFVRHLTASSPTYAPQNSLQLTCSLP